MLEDYLMPEWLQRVQAELAKQRAKREQRAARIANYPKNGLNGPRAVARRCRQRLKIEARMAAA